LGSCGDRFRVEDGRIRVMGVIGGVDGFGVVT
jgi:hypothetical protein